MKKNKRIAGWFGVLTGCIVFMLIMDILSKPTNVPLSLKPIESLELYFFGFVFGLGDMGWVLGSLLLIGYLALFYFIGIWIYKLILKR